MRRSGVAHDSRRDLFPHVALNAVAETPVRQAPERSRRPLDIEGIRKARFGGLFHLRDEATLDAPIDDEDEVDLTVMAARKLRKYDLQPQFPT